MQSYGKAGLVGVRGEQEHANALLTTVFANPFRAAIGGAAWISSVTKVGAPGTPIDVPLNCIDDVYVRSHYDAISLCLPDTPMPDEIALIFCVSSGGRLNARVGGLSYAEAAARQRCKLKKGRFMRSAVVNLGAIVTGDIAAPSPMATPSSSMAAASHGRHRECGEIEL